MSEYVATLTTRGSLPQADLSPDELRELAWQSLVWLVASKHDSVPGADAFTVEAAK